MKIIRSGLVLRIISSVLILISVVLAGGALGQAQVPASPDFRNINLPIQQRVNLLIAQLTVDEKISQMMKDSPAIPRLGIPAYNWWNEALHGLARNGVATVFPQAIALAATWDPDLHFRIADVISTEARAKNNEAIRLSGGDTKGYQGLTLWSPNINIFRDPRWGRGQETYGEDPYLTGRFGVAFVHGLQGNDPTYLKTVATLKHFAVHSGPEALRHVFDAKVSARDFHETYLPAFEAGVREGGAWSIMSAYNAINGVPAPANKLLLTDILRGQWGFQGAVVSDVDSVADIASHHYAVGPQASALAVQAGNDLCSGGYYHNLQDALKAKLITEADLDQALRRLFLLRFKLGQFDPPDRVPYRKIPLSEVDSPAHSQLALQASRESLVLLKNDGTLPWNPKEIKTLAILGPTATQNAALVGNYSGKPSKPVNILQGLQAKLEPLGVKVVYEAAVPLVAGFQEIGQHIPKGVLFTDDSKSIPGLKGELFDNPNFTGKPTATRTDEEVDFTWNEAQPVPEIPLRNAHLRWTGVLVPPTSGDYVLSLTFIGTARVYVDDKLLVSEEKAGAAGKVRTMGAPVSMTAGQTYHVRIESNEKAGDTGGKVQFGWRPPQTSNDFMAVAKQADHILLTLGITPELEGEEMDVSAAGFGHGDRTSILLPKSQRDLIDQVAALGKPFVVLLTNGSALSFDPSKPNAILEAWYYGERGGDAIADVLCGDYNPAGRLPITFYQSDSDLAPFENYSMANRTYRYFTRKPLYAFGYGLSYTTFHYDHLTLSVPEATAADTVNVVASVTNTGQCAGDEVVEVYAHAVHPPVPMPIESLVGFQRLNFQPGETKTVTIPIKVESLRRWDETGNHYVVDPGDYELRVGPSSDKIESALSLKVR